MNRLKATILFLAFSAAFTACKKNSDAIIIVPASDGSKLQLNGLVASESGSSAGNSVYVDLSMDKATAVQRSSWDLGFYSGSDFRVIINNTTTAAAKMITKNDLTQVVAADTAGFAAQMSGLTYSASDFAFLDNVLGDLSKTVIAGISATDADNKVYIINRGTGGSIAARDWYKIRILRKGAGYMLQYAKLSETNFKTLDITKNGDYNFQYASFDNGTVAVEPAKAQWDFVWSYRLYQTPLNPADATSLVPYAVADFVCINEKAGVQAAQVLTTAVAYADFDQTKIASVTFSSSVDVIGTGWRTASASPSVKSGVKTDRFYVLKDAAGNIYKLRFLSFHADDGGTRGKPEFEYKLVKKG